MLRSATDIAVIGGGPAGAAAALTIARHTGRACTVLEASGFEGTRIGETVSPALLPMLDYLGIEPEPSEMLPCFGSDAACGRDAAVQRASIFSGEGTGWTIDRARFDARLAAAAEGAGAELRRGAIVRGADPEPDGGWTLRFDWEGVPHRLFARQVIDASGRRAAFARRAGASPAVADRLVAVATYVATEAAQGRSILIESARDGWWYLAALPNAQAILVYLTDADLLRQQGTSLEALLDDRLCETRHVRARLGALSQRSAVRVYPAHAQRLETPFGADWLAAGDAAASFDPLSSLGIGHALASGIQAARIAHRRLSGGTALAEAYARDLRQVYEEHLHRREALYATEARWPNSTFWRRRAGAEAGVTGSAALAAAAPC